MSNEPPANPLALRCPSCGAALPDGGNRVECAFCGTVVDVRRQRQAQSTAPAASQTTRKPARATIFQSSIPARKRNTASGGCAIIPLLVTLGVIAMIVGVIFLVSGVIPGSITSTKGPSFDQLISTGPKFTMTDSALLLEDTATSTTSLPQIVSLVRTQDDNAYHLALIDPSNNTTAWVGPALSDMALSYAHYASTPDTILFVDERTLLAFNRADGTQRWSTTLTDRLCERCLVVVNDTVITQGIDNQLSSIDLESGEMLWSRELDASNGRVLYAYGDTVLLLEDNEENTTELRFINPTNSAVERSITPACQVEDGVIEASTGDTYWIDPSTDMAVFLSTSFKSCVHAYNLSDNQQRWQTITNSEIYTSRFDSVVKPVDNQLLVSLSGKLASVNLDTGELRSLVEDNDYEFYPLAAQKNNAVVIAIRSRGTTRAELWGIDLNEGKRRWRSEFAGDGQMIGPPFAAAGTVDDNESIWTWVQLPDGLAIVSLATTPQRFIIKTIDMASGQETNTSTIDRPDDDIVWVPGLVARRGSTLILEQNNKLVVIDAQQRTISYEGP